MKKIILYPNSVLRTKTPAIKEVDKKLESEIEKLKIVLENCENGAGLAATQIGIKKRFFGIKEAGSKKVKVYINPRVTKKFGKKVYCRMKNEKGEETDFLEGCLSFPDLFGMVKRYLKIEAEWMGQGPKILEGFEAIVFQHEADHLDGVLFIDHVKKEGGKLYRWVGEKKEEISLKDSRFRI